MEGKTNLDEYEKLVIRMSTPSVIINNAGCSNATIVMIDSWRRHRILLEAVQILTDLNLSIKKAYVSSDGRWFMDVFHVTDMNGNRLTDAKLLSYIEQSLQTIPRRRSIRFEGLTALELTGSDRFGLLSEVFAVLSDLNCNIVEAKVWTHNGRIASLIYLDNDDWGSSVIETKLTNLLKSDNDICGSYTMVSMPVTHTERRLHQIMMADRDYERKSVNSIDDHPIVSVQNYLEKDYSVVNIQCKDRTKLFFDIICTLTDMEYVVFHATVDTPEDRASLEFFIRHIDGTPISSEAEKQRVILCLEAAIQRRASQGLRLELSAQDKKGLLADVTRTLRENGLNVTRAEVSTSMNTTHYVFYLTDRVGNIPDSKTIESVKEKIGLSNLKVVNGEKEDHTKGAMLFSLLRRNFLYSLGWIKSCS